MTKRNEPQASSAKLPSATIARASAPRRLRSVELFAGANELVILHDEREYRLRITQNGRLILTA
jgi:hemin uptake protein HemP